MLSKAFIFMLAIRDVSAAREGFQAAQMVSLSANTMEQSSKFHDRVSNELSIWARQTLKPIEGQVSFRTKLMYQARVFIRVLSSM